MSMRDYPVHLTALYVDYEVLTYIQLAYDQKHDSVPDEVKEAIADGSFVEKSKNGTLYDFDLIEDVWTLMEEVNGCVTSSFTGDIETLEECKSDAPLAVSFDDQTFCYVPLDREPSLFECAYESPEACIAELKEKFQDAGIDVPDAFDWAAHLVTIFGNIYG